MRYIFVILILALSMTASAETEFYNAEPMNCSFEYPSGWTVQQISTNRIELSNDTNIVIDIVKYAINQDETIRAESDLYEAIAGLYADLGISLNENEEIGYSVSPGMAEFEQEYIIGTEKNTRKKIKGIVLRNIYDQQIFYLLTAEINDPDGESTMAEIATVFDSFRFEDVLADELFQRRSLLPYLQVMLILALAGFFYARNRRVQRSKNPLGLDSGSHWRCPHCRKVNHDEFVKCSRCGRERQSKLTGHTNR